MGEITLLCKLGPPPSFLSLLFDVIVESAPVFSNGELFVVINHQLCAICVHTHFSETSRVWMAEGSLYQ